MHSVFSDGHVWPDFRVREALRDGLDAISITEHTDFKISPDNVPRDLNLSYQIALEYARDKDILIINGAEISPRVPPYHNNALFLKDANLPFDYMKVSEGEFIMKDQPTHAQLMAPFIEAEKQGAFVFFNHPGNMPAWVIRDTAVFTDFHKELHRKKILSGIEVANSGVYNVTAHRLAMKYGLTILCNTDEHWDMYPRYQHTHRPMTLVFAKEKTTEAIREALMAGRTAAYFEDYLVAREPEASAFFTAAIKAEAKRVQTRNGPALQVSFFNNCTIPFRAQISGNYDIEQYPLGQVTLASKETTTISMRIPGEYPEIIELKMTIMNILITPDKPLTTKISLSTLEK